MPEHETPDVPIEEASTLPASVAEVASAIPAFIGYTGKAVNTGGDDLLNRPVRIGSMLEFIEYFGQRHLAAITVNVSVTASNKLRPSVAYDIPGWSLFRNGHG